MSNPFTPNFGQVPCELAGRELLISELSAAFDNAPGDPNLTTILIGARGTGKTALLTYMSSVAGEHGWVSVNASCVEGLLEEILAQARYACRHLLEDDSAARVTGVSANINVAGFGGGVEVRRDASVEERGNWRIQMTELLEELARRGSGLLITIDEVNPKLDEMVKFASAYQMFIREERPIALLMAGLPHNVSLLLNAEPVSFLRRSRQQYLGAIPDYEVASAFRRTIESAGKTIDSEALSRAVAAIEGFPFMLQLVGYRAWAAAQSDVIDEGAVDAGISMARNDLEMQVLKSTLDVLSDMSIKFLLAMTEDEQSSTLTDIAQRLGKSSSYVSGYKRRLLEHGVVEDAGRGKLRFALPVLREYLPVYAETNF